MILIERRFEVCRLPLEFTNDNARGIHVQSFNSEEEAIAAIKEWYDDNLCPDGIQAMYRTFNIYPFTQVYKE